MCSGHYVFFFLSLKITSAWLTFWKTKVIGNRYYVRSADENVGGSMVDIFWKTDEVGKLYYVHSADENAGGSAVDIFWKI